MMDKVIKDYFEEHWKNDYFLDTVTDLSKREGRGIGSLVKNDRVKFYNMDKICKAVFEESQAPASADAINITDKEIEVIEFKSGFKRNITKENLDKNQMLCEKAGNNYCEEYGTLFLKEQKMELDKNKENIRLKAVETYMFLEKKIFCKFSPETRRKTRIVYKVVIDADPVDNIEDILLLAAKKNKPNNQMEDLRRGLRRYVSNVDENEMPYYYDRIEVKSYIDYENELNRMG